MKPEYTKEQWELINSCKKYNKDGFFNLKGYIEMIVGEDWDNKPFSLIVQAARNMGKSFGTWEFIEKEIWIKSNFTERIAYCRTNMTKLKAVKSFFNSKYRGKYLMTDTHIWKIELDALGKEIREKRIELGAVIGVMNEENWRSGEFANYRLIFWDEYNESNTHIGLFEHWINLFKTIERMCPNMITILVGNKINANNDILVNLEIELPDIENQTSDIVLGLPEEAEEPSIYFLDVAYDTFIHLGQEEKQANIWARYNDTTNAFLNEGAFLEQQSRNVIIYRKKILPTKQLKYYVGYKDQVYEFGSFEKGVYFHKIRQDNILEGYRVIALDVAAAVYVNKSRRVSDEDDFIDFAELLTMKAKNNQLYFSTFEAKEELETFIINYTNLVI